MTEPRRLADYTAAARAARQIKDSPTSRLARDLQNSPAFRYAREARASAAQSADAQRESDRLLKEVGARQARRNREKIEHERTTADSTAVVAAWAKEQSEENRRLRYLTNVLAFAVIYDLVNGSFDDHTLWTTLISATTGVSVFGVALALGKLRRLKQSRFDVEAC